MSIQRRAALVAVIVSLVGVGGIVFADLQSATDEQSEESLIASGFQNDGVFTKGDIKPELRQMLPNPATNGVSSLVVRLFPNMYLTDLAIQRERMQVANAAVVDLAACYRSTHGLTGKEANIWARFVFDSTYTDENGSSFLSTEKGASQDGLVDLGIDTGFSDSNPSDKVAENLEPEVVLGSDGQPLKFIPFPEDEPVTVYEDENQIGADQALQAVDYSDAANWGPCSSSLGSYLDALTFGALASELSGDNSPFLTEQESGELIKLAESYCVDSDLVSQCDEFLEMMTLLYPVHESIVNRLIEEGRLEP